MPRKARKRSSSGVYHIMWRGINRHFKIALRYIHQTPMKAGLARNVFESKWTSINEYLKKANLVDVDVGFGIFSYDRKKAIKMFIQYMNQSNGDQCLDDNVKVRISDQEVREYLNRRGIINNSTIQRLERGARDEVLSKLKKLNGVSVRQLSRITGISKSVIDRVRR